MFRSTPSPLWPPLYLLQGQIMRSSRRDAPVRLNCSISSAVSPGSRALGSASAGLHTQKEGVRLGSASQQLSPAAWRQAAHVTYLTSFDGLAEEWFGDDEAWLTAAASARRRRAEGTTFICPASERRSSMQRAGRSHGGRCRAVNARLNEARRPPRRTARRRKPSEGPSYDL